ncbi:MAG TPA: cell wall-binding repeat-containing protein [Coriobacteriia bacterium]|nr:cell wall-binding repeat-containing protein [Coriobacteriia bacterium]
MSTAVGAEMKITRLVVVALVVCVVCLPTAPAAFAASPDDAYPGVPIPASPFRDSLDATDPLAPADREDWFSIDLDEGERLKVHLDNPDLAVSLIALYREGATEATDRLAWDGWPRTSKRLTYVVPAGEGGTFYLEIAAQARKLGWYELEYAVDDEPFTLQRIAGADRYETAIAVSRSTWETGTVDVVVLASGEDYPDALCAAPLAAIVGGPVLLTSRDEVLPAVADEIRRLGATRAYIVGGTAALSDEVVRQLREGDGYVEAQRIGGADRYATSREIGRFVAYASGSALYQEVFLARGDDFADALSCSAIAARWQVPILLTRPTTIDPETFEFVVDSYTVRIVGGTSAVSQAIEDRLTAAMQPLYSDDTRVLRYAGPDRYATAALLATAEAEAVAGYSSLGIATGERFPDALALAPYLAEMNGCLLLTRSDALPDATADAIGVVTRAGVDVVIVGGTAAIVPGVEADIRQVLEQAYLP